MAFSPEAAAITGQLSIMSNHPVAGDDDGESILADGAGNRAGAGRAPDAGGQLAVGDGLTIGNRHECLPDLLLMS